MLKRTTPLRKTVLKRSTKPLKRVAVKKKRSTPRRGRVIDREYLAWLHTQPGVVFGGKTHSVHHVREFGSPKNDYRSLPLEFGYHQIHEGAESIEAIGKTKWQILHGVSIEGEIARLNFQYDADGKVTPLCVQPLPIEHC